jgi:hypothetical protein
MPQAYSYHLYRPYWAWSQASYVEALQCLLQQGSLLASLPPATIKNMALTYWVKCGSLENLAWVGQILDWADKYTAGSSTEGANAGTEQEGVAATMDAEPGSQRPSEQPPPAMGAGIALSFRPHPELAPFLDLAPAPTDQSRATMRRFVQLQVRAQQQSFADEHDVHTGRSFLRVRQGCSEQC